MNTSEIVNGFRKALQDLLVPEIRIVQTEIKHLNEKIDRNQLESNKRFEAMDKRFEAMDKRFEAMQLQMDKRFEAVHKEIKEMQHEMHTMNLIQQKILDKLDVEKRMTRIETLMEQVLRKAA